ncbi:MAG TPA: hypothetical protein VD886_05270 [Herpetosiphonaceae bacterium]|nr:hypothetical protein [Herpetosiphonaceae bacterium]
MDQQDEILLGVKCLRSVLPQLIGAEADPVDAKLAAAFALNEPDRSERIVAIVADNEVTRAWINRFVDFEGERTYTSVGPGVDPVSASAEYFCAQCGERWIRHQAAQPVPAQCYKCNRKDTLRPISQALSNPLDGHVR